MTHQAVGAHAWAIGDGWIPPSSTGPAPEFTSHDTICILNAGAAEATVSILVYFSDRPPAGPFSVRVPGERVQHLRVNDFEDPESIPRGVDYSVVIRSDRPIVVQHTRLDSRQAENALMTTIAFPGG